MKLRALQAFYIPVFCIGQDGSTNEAYRDNADTCCLHKENATPWRIQDGKSSKDLKKEVSMNTDMSVTLEHAIFNEVEKLGLTANNTRGVKDVVPKMIDTNQVIKDCCRQDILKGPTNICNIPSLNRISSNNLNLIPKSERHNTVTQSRFKGDNNSARFIEQNDGKISRKMPNKLTTTVDLSIEDTNELACVNCTVLRNNDGLKCSYSAGCLNIIQDGVKIVWNIASNQTHSNTCQSIKENKRMKQQEHSESYKNGANNVNNNSTFESLAKSKTESKIAENSTNASSLNIQENPQCSHVGIKSFGQKSMQWVKTVKVRQTKREHNMFSPSSF